MLYHEPESSTVEWKLTTPANDQIIKTIVGFCNLNGGKLVIGVDNDGTVVGIVEDEVQKILEYLNASIYQATSPSIIPNVYAQNIDGKILVVVAVSAGMNKPYLVKSLGAEKGVYIRLGRSTVRASDDMIDELKLLSRGKLFDKMPMYQATMRDFDEHKIHNFLKKRAEKKGVVDEKEALYAHNFIVDEHAQIYPTIAGILLLGKAPQDFFSEARVMCAHFPGIDVKNEALATRECVGTLFEQFNEAFNFILSRLNHSWIIRGAIREDTLEIPQEAIREVLINALVHRNYHIQAPCKVALFDNRIEIFSPGNFPGPLNQQNLRSGFTFVRNSAICGGFREMGMIESFGTGLQKLFSSYEAMNLRPPQIIDDANYIKCILPRGMSALLQVSKSAALSKELQKLLDLFNYASDITISDVISNLRIARSTAGRRIATLVEQGLIEKIGEGKSVRYMMKKNG